MEKTILGKKIMSALSAAEAVSDVLGPGTMSRIRELGVYVVASAGVASGVVLVEGAHSESYTGTWATLATITLTGASRVHYAAVTGVHLAVRLRISTVVAGGTVDGHIVSN